MGFLLPIEQLAIYSAASRFPMAIDKNIFHKPITAKLAYQSNKQHFQTLRYHWWKLVLLGLLLCFTLWVSLPYLIKLFFNDPYSQAVKYARLLSLSVIPLPLWWVTSDILLYQKRGKSLTLIMNIPTITMIILQLMLIPSLGIYGLVFSIIFSRYTVLFISLLYLIKRKSD